MLRINTIYATKSHRKRFNIQIIAPARCSCAGMTNEYGEGSECKEYSGYEEDWYNGRWCFAPFEACSDATEHPLASIPGIGASKMACTIGLCMGHLIMIDQLTILKKIWRFIVIF